MHISLRLPRMQIKQLRYSFLFLKLLLPTLVDDLTGRYLSLTGFPTLIFQGTPSAQSAAATPTAQPPAGTSSAKHAAAAPSGQPGPPSSCKPPRKRAATSQPGQESAQPRPSSSRGRGTGGKRGRRQAASALPGYQYFTCSGNY